MIWASLISGAKSPTEANQIQMLISSQRTNIIKGFTSKKGKQFDASLKIDNYGKIEFVFPSAKKGKKK